MTSDKAQSLHTQKKIHFQLTGKWQKKGLRVGRWWKSFIYLFIEYFQFQKHAGKLKANKRIESLTINYFVMQQWEAEFWKAQLSENFWRHLMRLKLLLVMDGWAAIRLNVPPHELVLTQFPAQFIKSFQ